MWNKLAEMMQDPSYKRLGLALIVSIILHAFLFGNLGFVLPHLKREMHLIEARIQMPKAVAKQVAVPNQEEVVAAKQILEPKPQVPVEPKSIAEAEAPTEVSAVTPPIPSSELPVATQNNEPVPLQEEQQSEDMGLVINENAYQYVETEFEVRTEIDGKAQGKATITFNLVTGKQYQLKWLTQPSGVAALFIGDLLQTSEGELTKAGLQPSTYLYQYGNKADKTRSAIFDWQAKQVISQSAKGSKTESLPDGAQDMLSFMYQFMYVPPLQSMQIAITNGKKMRIYDYSFAGEENINSALGELKTIHIVHTGSVEEDKTELWLALDYQYVPVKIRKTESDNKVYELLATRINTNRPVIDK